MRSLLYTSGVALRAAQSSPEKAEPCVGVPPACIIVGSQQLSLQGAIAEERGGFGLLVCGRGRGRGRVVVGWLVGWLASHKQTVSDAFTSS